MSYLFNDPADFADELADGFALASARWVRRVPGGVVRNTTTPAGQVAVVIGGGSGHYPAFAGLVGTGLAHGAAMGNLFASPSAQQVYSVAKAAAGDAGILFVFCNYAGDVLNFKQAQERLRAEGYAVETVLVTDDVTSAPAHEAEKRRGIAGSLAVFRAAGVAADAGLPLAEVARLAAHANSRTRSLGVAFAGCTLPGATEPLFTVPSGRMAVGMGIHGEPGISEAAVPTAAGLAELLVRRLLAEAPADADGRVAVILNGLGRVKYEELFVTFGEVSRLLDKAGLTMVEPEVGEFVTSFEMAGASLSIVWLDDELEPLWRSPADSPAYRKATRTQVDEAAATTTVEESTPAVVGSPESQSCAMTVVACLEATAQTLADNESDLGHLDAVAGDGDHGLGMRRGSTAALTAARGAADAGAGVGGVLRAAGEAWADKAGGTSGAIWGRILTTLADQLGDEHAPGLADLVRALQAANDAVTSFGGAQVGDKTLLDTLSPFTDTLRAQSIVGRSLTEAWHDSATVADTAAAATAVMTPRVGRARPLAVRSLGTPDPGAVSMALVVRAVATVLDGDEEPDA